MPILVNCRSGVAAWLHYPAVQAGAASIAYAECASSHNTTRASLGFPFCVQSRTTPPPRLTEAALISLMERHGIGTDATVAEHINKQLERGCGLPSLTPLPS